MRPALLWLALAGCGGASSAPAPDPDDTGGSPTAEAPEGGLTVLSLNLHCLRTDDGDFASNAERLDVVAELVVDESVDVLALQEVCAAEEDALSLLVDALEARTGEGWASHRVFAHLAWEGTADEAEESVALVGRALNDPWELVYFAQGGLQRVAAGATVDGVTVVSVHLDHDDDDARLAQARHTAAHALTVADPDLDVVLAGDFNARPGSPAHEAAAAMGFVDASAGLDDGRIDHVFAHRGAGLAPASARLVFTGAAWPVVSDHPGVLVRFEAQEPPPVTRTRLQARADVGWGHWLAARGDAAPLDWDAGWPMVPVAADDWRLVLTELDGPFAWKVLVDDAVWQLGDDVAGEAGADNVVEPAFP